MIYGAKGITTAVITAEPDNVLPTYGESFVLGELNRVADSPAFNEAKGYGDNALKRHVVKFREATVDVTVLDMSNEHAATIFGAEIPDKAAGDLHFTDKDNPPYCGLAFYINELLEDNADRFKGIFYPKVKAAMQGSEYATNGESITLTAKALHFTASAANSGDWKIESEYFETETEAQAWVANMVKATA